jgi:hypothetical protein
MRFEKKVAKKSEGFSLTGFISGLFKSKEEEPKPYP